MLPDSTIEHAMWFVQNLRESILPRRLELSPRDNGFFRSQFDREWKPGADGESGTLVSQARGIYMMSVGFKLTADDRYLAALEKGVEFLDRAFRDTEAGGHYWSCDSSGAVTDDSKRSYGHSFVIFALANAALSTTSDTYADLALAAWREYQEHFTNENGGFFNVASRTFEPNGESLSQNPIMHLFEALLSLGETKGNRSVLEDAMKIADFVTRTLIDIKTGFLPELFTSSWLPAKESLGNRIDVGHAFEWAFLLSRGVQLGLPKRYLQYAHQFLDSGITLGFDRERGLVFSPASLDGERVERSNHYWEQCEALRTFLHFAWYRDRGDLCSSYDRLAGFVREHYVDKEHGGWYTEISPKGTPVRPEKGSVWKIDYHPASMAIETKRIVEAQRL